MHVVIRSNQLLDRAIRIDLRVVLELICLLSYWTVVVESLWTSLYLCTNIGFVMDHWSKISPKKKNHSSSNPTIWKVPMLLLMSFITPANCWFFLLLLKKVIILSLFNAGAAGLIHLMITGLYIYCFQLVYSFCGFHSKPAPELILLYFLHFVSNSLLT